MTDTIVNLKIKLKEKLAESGLSVNALEKQAGLKRSAVHNILHDRSKKPSAEILQAIARVFDCSIDELLPAPETGSRPLPVNLVNSQGPGEESMNFSLYIQATQLANELTQAKGILMNKKQALNYINELYQYAFGSPTKAIDSHFAAWLMDKMR